MRVVFNDVSAVGLRNLGGKSNVVLGSGAVLHRSVGGCVTLMRSVLKAPHHNASCTRRCPVRRDPPETRCCRPPKKKTVRSLIRRYMAREPLSLGGSIPAWIVSWSTRGGGWSRNRRAVDGWRFVEIFEQVEIFERDRLTASVGSRSAPLKIGIRMLCWRVASGARRDRPRPS